MQKFLSLLILILFLSFSLITGTPGMPGPPGGSSTVQAVEVEVLARSLGMGGAQVAVADDASATIFNPAGLYQSGRMGIMASGGFLADNVREYGDLLDTIDDFSSQADSPEEFYDQLPEEVNLRGQGLAGFQLGTGAVAGNFKARLTGERGDDSASYAYEGLTQGRLGMAGDIVTIPAEVGLAAYGLSINYSRVTSGEYELNYDSENPADSYQIEWQGSDSGLSVDAGLLLQLTPMVKMGVSVENFWAQNLDPSGARRRYNYDVDPAEQGGEWVEDEAAFEDDDNEDFGPDYSRSIAQPRRGRVGVAVDLPILGIMAADINNFPALSASEAGDPSLHLGLETDMLLGMLTLRAGTYSTENSPRMLTAGAGLNFVGGSLDLGAGVAPAGGRSSILAAVSLDL